MISFEMELALIGPANYVIQYSVMRNFEDRGLLRLVVPLANQWLQSLPVLERVRRGLLGREVKMNPMVYFCFMRLTPSRQLIGCVL